MIRDYSSVSIVDFGGRLNNVNTKQKDEFALSDIADELS